MVNKLDLVNWLAFFLHVKVTKYNVIPFFIFSGVVPLLPKSELGFVLYDVTKQGKKHRSQEGERERERERERREREREEREKVISPGKWVSASFLKKARKREIVNRQNEIVFS